MQFRPVDQFRDGSSLVHLLDPRSKVAGVLFFVLTVSLMPSGDFLGYLFLYILLLVAILLAKIGYRIILSRSFIAIPFALAAVTLLFTVPGNELLAIPLFGGLTITVEGVERFLSIVIKSWISVQAALLLVAVTPFSSILWSLRSFRVPRPLVSIIGFTYRYLFLLSDEAQRLMRARTARSATLGEKRRFRDLLWRGKVTGQMVGSLMLRSIERSERVHDAMLARGYRGQVLMMSNPSAQRRDYLAFALIVALCSTLLFFAYGVLGGGTI